MYLKLYFFTLLYFDRIRLVLSVHNELFTEQGKSEILLYYSELAKNYIRKFENVILSHFLSFYRICVITTFLCP